MVLKKIKILGFAQFLVIAALISLMTSPPLANFFELLVFISIILSSELRQRFCKFLMSSVGLWILGFSAILGGALIYGIASTEVIMQNLYSWRRLLLLPVAASLFTNDPNAKRNAAICYFYASAAFVLYSYISYLFPENFYWISERGVVVRNHVTQGMFFSASILIGITAIHLKWYSGKWQGVFYFVISILLFLNISLLMTGRSGYIALIAMSTGYFLINKIFQKKIHTIIIATITTLILIGTFTLSPIANKKLTQAYNEAIQADANMNSDTYTSIGVRIIFWRNTLHIIPKYLIFGVGTAGFEKAYANEVAGKLGLAGILTGDPHNQYLKIAVEQGLVGLVCFLGLLYMVACQSASQPFKNLGICILIAWCCTSLFNAHFSTFSEGHFIWMWLGIMLAPESALKKNSLLAINKRFTTAQYRTAPAPSPPRSAVKSACR